MSLASKSLLQTRAHFLKKVRTFFDTRKVMEVDTPLLSPYAPIDVHIDLFETQTGFLHSSPEYAMKKLLASGSGDIYQLCHVYRFEEQGKLHHPVFTLIEWYRTETSYKAFIQEICDLTCLFLGSLTLEKLTYQEAFQKHLQLDPFNTSPDELLEVAHEHDLHLELQPIDALLNELWGCLVEPHLGKETLTLIEDYPASQAALAQIKEKNGLQVAERFEVYFRGIELGNGYHELRDSKEQRRRLEQANQERLAMDKPKLPLDPHFLAAVDHLPDCYGMAMGFDRLLMLSENLDDIHQALS